MLTLKKVKELVEAPSHSKRTPSPKMLFEEGIVLLRREFDQGSHLTVYNSGYVLFSAGKRNTVFHISHPREILLALNVHSARLTRENAAEIWGRNGLGQNGKTQITADTLRWSMETCSTVEMYCYFQ